MTTQRPPAFQNAPALKGLILNMAREAEISMKEKQLKPIWVKPKTHLKVKKEAVKRKVTMSNLIDNLIK
jgi:hypothetical protein